MNGTFDRIVSVGMLEHVGPANYDTLFEKVDELLAPDGLMLHHTIGGRHTKKIGDPWFDRYIFPGGVIPSLPQLAGASENTWVIEDLHNFGPDDDRTLMAGHDRIEDACRLQPADDEHLRRTWRYYLMASSAGFRTRSLQ